jgi:hypothetical protein
MAGRYGVTKSGYLRALSLGVFLCVTGCCQLFAASHFLVHRAREAKPNSNQPVYLPTQSDLNQALDAARDQWGVPATPVSIRLEPFSECESIPGKSHTIAKSEMDGSRIITINANCNWAEFSLTVTILHEYGHILLGTPEHSSDPRSVMYSVVLPNQTITAADREKLQAKNQ